MKVKDVTDDLTVQLSHLQAKYGFSEGDEHGDHGKDDTFAFGKWLALKELQWRMNNPDYLGKPQS